MAASFRLCGLFHREDSWVKERSFCQALVTKLEKIRCTYFGPKNFPWMLDINNIGWTIFLVTWGVKFLLYLFSLLLEVKKIIPKKKKKKKRNKKQPWKRHWSGHILSLNRVGVNVHSSSLVPRPPCDFGSYSVWRKSLGMRRAQLHSCNVPYSGGDMSVVDVVLWTLNQQKFST